jgi:5'-deoxynucleotidase YfbR-like HD superfamily hydrolase
MNSLQKLLAIREAGHVERCHTMMKVRPYNLAAHLWGTAVLVRQLWPGDYRLMEVALLHDVPERFTGDLPSTALTWLGIGEQLKRCEREITSRLQIPCEHDLDEESWRRLRCADNLELLFWVYEEEAMGNRTLAPVRAALMDRFNRLDAEGVLPAPVATLLKELDAFGWSRMGASLPLDEE